MALRSVSEVKDMNPCAVPYRALIPLERKLMYFSKLYQLTLMSRDLYLIAQKYAISIPEIESICDCFDHVKHYFFSYSLPNRYLVPLSVRDELAINASIRQISSMHFTVIAQVSKEPLETHEKIALGVMFLSLPFICSKVPRFALIP